MRSAPCALAPSHSYHAMPPRITRNSHRPRASDRTMVNAESPVSLAALTNSTASPRHRGNLREWTTSQTSPGRQTYLQWAGSRDTISLSGRSGVFFLTSLFIELIDTTERKECQLSVRRCLPPIRKTVNHRPSTRRKITSELKICATNREYRGRRTRKADRRLSENTVSLFPSLPCSLHLCKIVADKSRSLRMSAVSSTRLSTRRHALKNRHFAAFCAISRSLLELTIDEHQQLSLAGATPPVPWRLSGHEF